MSAAPKLVCTEPGPGADLQGADLAGRDLTGMDLSRADLTGARLVGTNLARAQLFEARLDGAELLGADLTGADLTGASAVGAGFGNASMNECLLFGANLDNATLTGASLGMADLRTASLVGARLRGSNLTDAVLTGASLRRADLRGAVVDGANFVGADLGSAHVRDLTGYKTASWLEAKIADVDFCGAYLLRRFIMDQNYLHEFRSQGRSARVTYAIWRATSDCGRSFVRWGLWTALIAAIFAVVFTLVEVDYGPHETWISPAYYSVVTLTTLGYGDVLPVSAAAKALSMVEVVMGYVMLGGLLGIFANKMATRAG